MEYAIELKNVTKTFKDFKLNKVTFQVPKGCIMGFVGENGAGKSTTIKEILNLLHRESGEIKVFGKDNIQFEKEMKEDIGVVFDDSCFHDSFRIKDISKVMKNIYRKWDDTVFFEYTKKFHLTENTEIGEYSRGMKMKLTIAIALSHHAKLLILDEATSGLDPVARDEILDIFMEFIQEEDHTIFVSTHIISDLEKVADYITFIHKGEILFCKSKDELLYQYGIVKCTREEAQQLEQKHIVGIRKNQFGVEVLIDNKVELEKQKHTYLIDNTTIEEIILFMVRGERR